MDREAWQVTAQGVHQNVLIVMAPILINKDVFEPEKEKVAQSCLTLCNPMD